MSKTTTLALLAGLVTLTSVAPGFAQFTHAANNPRQPQSAATPYDCAEVMGYMRSVDQGDIFAINGNRIALLPVCEDLSAPGRNLYGPLFVNGNVNHLRLPIAENATLMAALTARGYDQNDVVSLRFGGGNSIILYVHQRDVR